jgi:hypothetical protein
MLHALLEAGQYAVTNLAVPVGASVATYWTISKVTKWSAAGGEVADHDRRAAEVNEDFRRWVRDRDRVADIRMNEIRQDANSKGVISPGLLRQSAGKVYRHVLHEYRDRATVAQREIDAILAAEGRAHERRRPRRGRAAPVLALPEDCRSIVTEWRQRAEDDPSRPELEPRLAGIERPLLAA